MQASLKYIPIRNYLSISFSCGSISPFRLLPKPTQLAADPDGDDQINSLYNNVRLCSIYIYIRRTWLSTERLLHEHAHVINS